MRLSYRPFALWISAATAATSTSSVHCFQKSATATASTAAFIGSRRLSSRPSSLIKTITTANKTFLRMASSTSKDNSSRSGGDNKLLRVALCQFYVTHNKEENHKTAVDYVDRAVKEGAEVIVLPEIWNSPYATSAFPEYAETLPQVGDDQCPESPSSAILMERAKQHNVFIVGGSIPEHENNHVYNTCLVYDPSGKVVAKHRKVHLFDIDVPGGITFFESDTLSPGNSLTTFSVPNKCDIGVGICYDIRFPEYAMMLCQSNSNCKLLLYPGAFNMTTGPAHWELLQRARALDNQCYVATASHARTEEADASKDSKYPHYTAWGHSSVVSPWGDVVTKADEKEALVVYDIDLDRVEEVRKGIPTSMQKRHDLYKLGKP